MDVESYFNKYFDDLENKIEKSQEQELNRTKKDANENLLIERQTIVRNLKQLNSAPGSVNADSLLNALNSRLDYDPNWTKNMIGQFNDIVMRNEVVANSMNQANEALSSYKKLSLLDQTSGGGELMNAVNQSVQNLYKYGQNTAAKNITAQQNELLELTNLHKAIYSFDTVLDKDDQGVEYQGYSGFQYDKEGENAEEIFRALNALELGGTASEVRGHLSKVIPQPDKRKKQTTETEVFRPVKMNAVRRKEDGSFVTMEGDQEKPVIQTEDTNALGGGFWIKERRYKEDGGSDDLSQEEVDFNKLEDHWSAKSKYYKKFNEDALKKSDAVVSNELIKKLNDMSSLTVSQGEMKAGHEVIANALGENILTVVGWGFGQRNWPNWMSSTEINRLNDALDPSTGSVQTVVEMLTSNPSTTKDEYEGLNKKLVNALDLYDKPYLFADKGRKKKTIEYLQHLVRDFKKFDDPHNVFYDTGNIPPETKINNIENLESSLIEANNKKDNAINGIEKTNANKEIALIKKQIKNTKTDSTSDLKIPSIDEIVNSTAMALLDSLNANVNQLAKNRIVKDSEAKVKMLAKMHGMSEEDARKLIQQRINFLQSQK